MYEELVENLRNVSNMMAGRVTGWCNEAADAIEELSKRVPSVPHGDLIDRDEYRDEFMNSVYELCSDDPDNCRANAIIDLFDCAPVITPAEPLKEGRKIDALQKYPIYGDMKVGITGLIKQDEDGQIRQYVPCKRNDDGAEGLICPETGDFIFIRPAEEE